MKNSKQKTENWKIVNDYPNYEVSDTGFVRNSTTLKILKPSNNGNGYFHVVLTKNKQTKTFYVHRLVAIAFVENPKRLVAVNHLNQKRSENQSANLEWTSILENCCHGFKNKVTTSNFTGVSFNLRSQSWNSSIFYNGKVKHIGSFKNEKEAYQARVDFEIENNILNKYL